MIKIGQIGIGHNHGEGKMLACRKRPDLFEVIGYSETDERWLQDRGQLPAYRDLPRLTEAELLEKADAVLVETDVWNLTKTAQRCVDAGKHIHMDKPASGTLAEYKHLLDSAEVQNLVIQLGYMYRYNPAVQQCIEAVKSGKLGEIYSLNAEMSTRHSVIYKKWLTNFHGGIMYILGSHLVDLAVYLLGEPQRVVSFLKHTNADDIDLEDNNLAVLEYEKALARIYVSSVEVNGWGRRQLVVSGSKGTIDIKPLENPIHMTYSDTQIAANAYQDMKHIADIADVPKDCRYDIMMQDFYDYVCGKKQNPFTYAHEYAVQKVLHQVILKDD